MASSSAEGEQRNELVFPQRPPLQSQLSNSVPSTPYHGALVIRSASRSPSPRRGLGNYSPRSVVSEAVEPNVRNGTAYPIPTAPVVCKFETAPEWRKRRIPYIDGGDQELGPPEKKPRATLEPQEEEKLTADMQTLYEKLLPTHESERRRVELVEKLTGIFNDEWPGEDIKVSVFGSSGNLLSSNDSDVDICVTTSLKKVESMHNLATLLNKNGMERVVCRAAAKVPIVKCWDPVLELACDINVNNPLALENTRMIKTYVQLDPRIRPLAKIIKHWTKERILNDAAFGGTISSYTWICMVINFLQQRQPPILPSLQNTTEARSTINGRVSDFADNVETLKHFGEANNESLGALLFHFFRYYAYDFEYSKYVVSVKQGRKLSRTEKGWDNVRDNKEARCRLCVEEPFNVSRNLGNSADEYAWSGIHGEIRRAFDLLADGQQLDKCCERFVFPPEEKSVFQRPAPKPKPTLTRSASQSGARPTQETHNTRSRKGSNRNASSHRSNTRRASSGAVFGNPRFPGLPNGGVGLGVDYYATKGNLHEQLFQQYQFLQYQQDALRSQLLVREQQAQGQTPAGSPNMRQHPILAHRLHDGVPHAPNLLPGSLYHFTARYPPSSPALMQQVQRSRDGSITNPSSPSLAHAVPANARQGNRASVVEGSSSTIRSQSQPGRSLPHPITLSQAAFPGYDVVGAYPVGGRFAVPNGYPYPLTPMAAFHPGGAFNGLDAAAPKEYVGYYVGQSPQLGPQYVNAAQTQIPTMTTLSNPPHTRQRRITPDLQPPIANGTAVSRSPSPREPVLATSTAKKTPPMYDQEFEGPLIVNGSTPIQPSKERSNGNIHHQINGDGGLEIPPYQQKLPLRTDTEHTEKDRASSTTSNKPLNRASPHLTLSPNGTPPNGLHTTVQEAAAPLLSPVAELRTPSPTLSSRLESSDWPQHLQPNGLKKYAKVASARLAEENSAPKARPVENSLPVLKTRPPTEPKHDRKLSVPDLKIMQTTTQSPSLTTPMSAGLPPQERNPWQQAISRKGHKKNKSLANAAASMQRSPVADGERKGG